MLISLLIFMDVQNEYSNFFEDVGTSIEAACNCIQAYLSCLLSADCSPEYHHEISFHGHYWNMNCNRNVNTTISFCKEQ
jgi:hypothetical protein